MPDTVAAEDSALAAPAKAPAPATAEPAGPATAEPATAEPATAEPATAEPGGSWFEPVSSREADFSRSLEVSHDATEAVGWFDADADLRTASMSHPHPPGADEPPRTPPSTPRPAGHPGYPPRRATPVTRIFDLDPERPLPSIERALSAPGGRRDLSWRRRVKVVAGGQGPGKRDQESLDRDRARLPLVTAKIIVVLGCHGGAGQTTTTLMTARLLATLRGHPVAAVDLNAADGKPGKTSGGNLDIFVGEPHPDYGQLAGSYPLTIVDPAPSGLTRVLDVADQLVIVAPPTSDGASSLANTQQWLDAHGQGELAARAVTVLNGVRKEAMADVLRAESVARGRCRAIVRVPWDEQLTTPPRHPQVPQVPQTRLAYTALAGVVIAGMAAPQAGGSPAPASGQGSGRSPGEHEG